MVTNLIACCAAAWVALVSVPAEKGDPRNLTNTPGVNERFPAWSPDGALIAYFSDESGEYELHVRNQDGKGEPKKYKLDGSGFYGSPSWSPDSQKIAYADNSLTLYWLDLKTGVHKKIGAEYMYQPGGQAGVADHLVIGAGARIAAKSGVARDVPDGETWAGIPAMPISQWRRFWARVLRDRH